jgi:hypothetical protein
MCVSFAQSAQKEFAEILDVEPIHRRIEGYYDRGMRGDDSQPDSMFSCVSPALRVPKDHPLRAIRTVGDEVLVE